jgi:penicillin-binding protein 4
LANKRKSKKSHKIRNRMLLSVFLILLALVVFLGIKFVPSIISLYSDASKRVNSISDNTFNQSQTTYLYDANDNVINNLYGSKNTSYLTYEKIPQDIKNAFVSVEDKDFFKHGGISIKANLRAVYSLIINKGKITQGGSTITQQLARNVFLNFDTSYRRKIEEMFISILLEQKYTKEQILEFYINNINYANGAYGIEAASKKYFNKDCGELQLSEMCFLAAIPNDPTYYDPIKNTNNTLKRRDLILSTMKQNGYITDDQYNKAISFKIVLSPEKYTGNVWVESYALDNAARILMQQKGFTFKNTFNTQQDKDSYDDDYSSLYNECMNEIRKSGYKIYTSIDMDKEKLLQNSVDNDVSNFKDLENGIYKLQSAAVSIDNSTGYVVAIVGGRTSPQKDYLNRAYQSFRQPGSSFKPLAVYTPSFEKGYTPATVINDHYTDGGPHNDSDVYMGNIPIRKATQMSLNTVAYQIFDAITPNYGLSFIKNMNFSKIVKSDYTLSAALGGLTNGVSPIEMASGYSTLARDGQYIAPTCIRSIVDSQGQTIYKNKIQTKEIYTDDASYLMTDILKGTLANPWGTAYSVRLNGITSAAKTGTTNDQKDGWLCGYSPYYTTVVWVGYDKPKPVPGLYGATYPGKIWHDYMQTAHAGLPDKDFDRPSDVQEVSINPATGEAVPGGFPNAVEELFSTKFLPKEDSTASNNNQNSTDTSNSDNTSNNGNTPDSEQTLEKIAGDAVSQYENVEITTADDIQGADALEKIATADIAKLTSQDVKTQLTQRVAVKKAEVDTLKKQLGITDNTQNEPVQSTPAKPQTNTKKKKSKSIINETQQSGQ